MLHIVLKDYPSPCNLEDPTALCTAEQISMQRELAQASMRDVAPGSPVFLERLC